MCCLQLNKRPAFSNSSGLKSVFEKVRFRDGLVKKVGLTVEIKLRLYSGRSLRHILYSGLINFLFVSTAPSVKPEQQQIPAQVPKTKKRQPVTPAAEFPDSDPEDDYDKG